MKLDGPHSHFEGGGKEKNFLAAAGNEIVVVQ